MKKFFFFSNVRIDSFLQNSGVFGFLYKRNRNMTSALSSSSIPVFTRELELELFLTKARGNRIGFSDGPFDPEASEIAPLLLDLEKNKDLFRNEHDDLKKKGAHERNLQSATIKIYNHACRKGPAAMLGVLKYITNEIQKDQSEGQVGAPERVGPALFKRLLGLIDMTANSENEEHRKILLATTWILYQTALSAAANTEGLNLTNRLQGLYDAGDKHTKAFLFLPIWKRQHRTRHQTPISIGNDSDLGNALEKIFVQSTKTPPYAGKLFREFSEGLLWLHMYKNDEVVTPNLYNAVADYTTSDGCDARHVVLGCSFLEAYAGETTAVKLETARKLGDAAKRDFMEGKTETVPYFLRTLRSYLNWAPNILAASLVKQGTLVAFLEEAGKATNPDTSRPAQFLLDCTLYYKCPDVLEAEEGRLEKDRFSALLKQITSDTCSDKDFQNGLSVFKGLMNSYASPTIPLSDYKLIETAFQKIPANSADKQERRAGLASLAQLFIEKASERTVGALMIKSRKDDPHPSPTLVQFWENYAKDRNPSVAEIACKLVEKGKKFTLPKAQETKKPKGNVSTPTRLCGNVSYKGAPDLGKLGRELYLKDLPKEGTVPTRRRFSPRDCHY